MLLQRFISIMFILNRILPPLKEAFPKTKRGEKRATWFIYTLVAIILPFASSRTSNLLRGLQTLFGLKIESQRFYAFMASPLLPWKKLWPILWGLISEPMTNGRIIVVLDDSLNRKSGKKIFGCGHFHDHTSKGKEDRYPWSQCIVTIGLLKKIKSRWACLPLSFRFYLMKKDIENKVINTCHKEKSVAFETKMTQSAKMLYEISAFYDEKILVVTDSWFGNNGLWSQLKGDSKGDFELLSRLRSNITLYDNLPTPKPGQKVSRGRPKVYGERLGSATDCAGKFKEKATEYSIFLYGKKRTVLAYSQDVMMKTLKCKVRVVWVFYKTRYVAFFSTDLSLSVEQIIEYYGARWKIESGFKELKQDIGSSKAQVRKADAVMNHLHFCMMASTVTWIYAQQLEKAPDRRHKIKGRASFAFSDIRRIMAEAILHPEFNVICPIQSKPPKNIIIQTLLRMVA